ncbi:MAG: hypothetical protein EBX35_14275 [Planctomycetia bacterium]|nr:hypothetical protein [Planctomycetia bacterium]
MMAGRLTGTLDGRPVVIEADGRGLTLVAATLRTAWATRSLLDAVLPALRVLKTLGVPLRVSVAGIVTVAVLPSPSLLARLAAPGLARLA